jgi:predicted acyltransferase
MATEGVRTRFEALDILRGLAVAGMILVVSPGSWLHRYSQLDHAAWHGWTAGDLVFPTFLFSVGVALGLSFPRPLGPAERAQAWARIARRTAALILLGLLLNALPWFDLAHLRIPGILQRIALCYALAASLCLLTARPAAGEASGRFELDPRAIAIAIAALLAGYWLLLMTLGGGLLDPAGNLGARIDRAIFTVPHLWPLGTAPDGSVAYDPEGLLSTLPAAANTLFGLLAAVTLRRHPERAALIRIAIAGAVLLLLGLLLDPLLPINKRIWTPSFALLSSGIAALLLALLGWALAWRPAQLAAAPLRILGGNAILAFTLSQLFGVLGSLPLLPGGQSAQAWGFAVAGSILADPNQASLLCALAILALITALIWPLHRKGVHLRL